MFFRKFVFISMVCCILVSCGYEGQEECESHFENQTYKYKEACNCLKEKAENNGIRNFKNFITVISDKNKGMRKRNLLPKRKISQSDSFWMCGQRRN